MTSEKKESPEDTIRRLTKELEASRVRLTDYKRMTRFVWDGLEHYRALCAAGLEAHVSRSIAARMTTRPHWQFKPSTVDGVFVLDVPAQLIHVRADEIGAEVFQ